jgi:unspecific monooxygenase
MGKFKEWSDKLATALGRIGVDMKLQEEMALYFGRLIDERKKKLGDDLISLLIQSEVDGEKLTKQDIVGFSILLLAAGNETTTNLITNGVLTLWENPGTFDLLKNTQNVIPSMVEEVLRFRSPVQSTRRIVKQETQFGEIKLKRGDFVKVYLGSANRDPAIFHDPETFMPERENNRHIAFGEGVHFCLGAPLARLEGKIAFETITSKYRDLEVKKPEPSQRLDSDIMYGFNSLLVKGIS